MKHLLTAIFILLFHFCFVAKASNEEGKIMIAKEGASDQDASSEDVDQPQKSLRFIPPLPPLAISIGRPWNFYTQVERKADCLRCECLCNSVGMWGQERQRRSLALLWTSLVMQGPGMRRVTDLCTKCIGSCKTKRNKRDTSDDDDDDEDESDIVELRPIHKRTSWDMIMYIINGNFRIVRKSITKVKGRVSNLEARVEFLRELNLSLAKEVQIIANATTNAFQEVAEEIHRLEKLAMEAPVTWDAQKKAEKEWERVFKETPVQ